MKIIELDEITFDNFSKSHRYRSFYQTSSYGNLMKTLGYEPHYLGFTNNNDELIGGTLILYKDLLLKYKYAYCPRGFLMDYYNIDLLMETTNNLKAHLYKSGFVYFKIDPLIHCSERNNKGVIVSYNPEINNIIDNFNKCGYKHAGFNKYFENELPRWNAIIRLNSSNQRLFSDFYKQTRNKIRKSLKCGVSIFRGTEQDIETFYNFVKDKNPSRNLNFYKNLFKCFGKNAELYLIKMEPHRFIETTKNEYERLLNINDQYAELIQSGTLNQKELNRVINKKMMSDRLLVSAQSNLNKASALFQNYREGAIIGAGIVIKQDKIAYLFEDGFDKEYKLFYPGYCLRWELIKKFNVNEYQYFDFGAMTGEFNENNPYSGLNEMKFGFNASAMEYIGEFEYIINDLIYNMNVKKKQ